MIWLTLLGCIPAPADVDCGASGQALGKAWRARWRARECDPELASALQARLDAIEKRMSIWEVDSEVNAIRRATGPVHVAEETWQTTRVALDVASISDGMFDPTIEPVLRAWGLHGEGEPVRPAPDALASARARVDYRRIQLGRDDRGPWVDASDTALDLTAVLEGHAVDRMSALLSARGLPDHLVDVGGELRVTGRGPRGLWRLGLDVSEGTPGDDLSLRLTNAALATSGVGRNPIVLDGETIHPKIDPTTGEPSTSDVVTVAVIAPTTRRADGLATAAALVGSSAALVMLENQPDVEGAIYTRDAAEPLMTSGMPALLAEPTVSR